MVTVKIKKIFLLMLMATSIYFGVVYEINKGKDDGRKGGLIPSLSSNIMEIYG